MPGLDPVPLCFRADAGVTAVKRYLLRARDPISIAVLQCFHDHLHAEMESDVEATLATMVDEPEFTFYADQPPTGPRGASQVRDFYAGLFRSRWFTHWAIDNMLVERTSLFVEGWHHAVLKAEHIAMIGLHCAPGALFRRTNRIGVSCGFELGPAGTRLVGETSYVLPPPPKNVTLADFAPVTPEQIDESVQS